MSKIYQNIMNRCYALYNQYKQSKKCQLTFDCKPECLGDMFRTNKNRSYDCKTITFMYVLRFMNKYASEIYYLFSKYLQDLPSDSLIFSIGCGPCMETVGIERFCRDFGKTGIKYVGTDINKIWDESECICCGETISESFLSIQSNNLTDAYIEKLLPHVNVLLINYMLSDYKNHNDSLQNYLEHNLKRYMDLMPTESFIIVNDQNHSGEWESTFDAWKENLPKNFVCADYFFDQTKTCNPRGTKISIKPFLFDSSNLPYASEFMEGLKECSGSGTIIHKDFPF